MMKTKNVWLQGGIALVVVLGAMGTGMSVLRAMSNDYSSEVSAHTVDANGQTDGVPEVPPFGVNADGLTYGSNAGSRSPEQDPDLVLVMGDNGHEGYVFSSELYQPMPSSPEEAVRTQARPGEIVAVLTVYKQDGETAIDTFTIAASGGN